MIVFQYFVRGVFGIKAEAILHDNESEQNAFSRLF